jgi:hypothetical protein
VSKKPVLLAVVLGFLLCLLMLSLATASSRILGAGDLLSNGDFEAGTSGWNVSYAATMVTVTTPVHSGNWAAGLNRSDTTGEIRIYQDVSVWPGATYTLTGWVYKDEPRFQHALLRIEWRNSQSPDEESARITDDNDYYRPITVGPVIAPVGVSDARISAVAEIRTSAPENPIYFDDLSLTSSMMPHGFVPLALND